MDLATTRCPEGHELELLAGARRVAGDDADGTRPPREPAWCPACDAYFWVVRSGPLVYVRNASPDTQTLNCMAGLLIDRGRSAQAQELLGRALRTSVAEDDHGGRALSLCQKARLAARQGDADESRILLGDALAALASLDDESARARLLHEMAGLLAASGEAEEALRLYLESLEIRERIGDGPGTAAALHEIAALRVDRGDVDEALWLCREALDIRQRCGDERGRAATLRLMGGIHATRGQVDRSLERFEESLQAFDKARDPHGRAAALGHMAELLADLGRISEATKLLREAMTLNRQIRNGAGVARILRRTANVLAGAGKLDGALRLLHKALRIHEQNGNVQGQSATYYQMGYQLSLRGRTAEARDHLHRALDLAGEIGDVHGQGMALLRLAQLTLTTDPVEAFVLLGRGERLLARVGAGWDLLDALQTHRAVARAARNSAEFCAASANLVYFHLVRGAPLRAGENAVWLAQKLPPERRDLVQDLASFALVLADGAGGHEATVALVRDVASSLGLDLDELRELTPEVGTFVAEQGALRWAEVKLGEWLLDAPRALVAS